MFVYFKKVIFQDLTSVFCKTQSRMVLIFGQHFNDVLLFVVKSVIHINTDMLKCKT